MPWRGWRDLKWVREKRRCALSPGSQLFVTQVREKTLRQSTVFALFCAGPSQMQ